MLTSNIKLIGYDTLGPDASEGIRYAWKHPMSQNYIESAAFIQHSKNIDDNVCGYTSSVSSGCILQSMDLACKFCRTGAVLPFGSRLNEFEIAKQNVFMVLADMHCSEHPVLHNRQREFAYMGQGEPGFSYEQIRKAIELTNLAMKELGQTVFRHIISTSGIPQMLMQYIDDLKTNSFSSRTTIHFSLHSTDNRNDIMPINQLYSYKESLNYLSEIFKISGEKPCIGILLLNSFKTKNSDTSYTTSFQNIQNILDELDSATMRLSFCEFNGSADVGSYDLYDSELSKKILQYAKDCGFEAKLFSSFGKKETTACGMLGGKEPQKEVSEKWASLELEAEKLISNIAKKNKI